MAKKESNHDFGFKIPGQDGTSQGTVGTQTQGQDNSEGSYKQLLGDKPITWFWLMQHYSKENAAAYKAQKAARKNRQATPIPEPVQNEQKKNVEIREEPVPKRKSVERRDGNFGGTVFVQHEEDQMPEAFLDCLSYRRKVKVNKRVFLIGRNSPDADLKMVDAPTVSTLHAEISFSNGTFYIEDLNSLNGVYLDGEQIRASVKTALQDRTTITLGNEKIIFRMADFY